MKITCRIENGDKVWRNERGEFSRKSGPAIEYSNGDKFWYKHGKLHRIKGPAIEWADGYKEWFYEGKQIDCNSQEEFDAWIKVNKL